MQSRPMDETWDMNMHLNPIDEETAETIQKHKAILMNNSDDFVAFVKHTESKLFIFYFYQFYIQMLGNKQFLKKFTMKRLRISQKLKRKSKLTT